MLVKTAIVVSLFVALSITAQVSPEVEPPPHPPLPEIDLQVSDSVPPTPSEEPDRELRVLARRNDRIRSEYIGADEILGPNGQLLLGGSDLQLKVFTGPIRFMTNGSSTTGVERMRIAPDTGNVSIGTPNAGAYKLRIYNNVAGSAFIASMDRTFTQNTAVHEAGSFSYMQSKVSEGVVQSGNAYGFIARSYLFDKGALMNAYGVYGEVGVHPGAAPNTNTGTITNAYGLFSRVSKNDGVIVNGYGLYLTDVTAINDWGVYQAAASDDNYFAGNVGIGTAPSNALHVSIADGATNLPVKAETTGVDSITGVSLKNDARNWHIRVDGTDADKLKIYDANAAASRLTITGAGDVGIGESSPTAKLHVNGAVLSTAMTVTGNIVAGGSITGATVIGAVYQDVAEWVPASVEMEPGTVVVLNHDRTNEVMPSHTSYDTSVAGVVSAQPGVLLGVAGVSKEQIATTGRVKVRVDATRAPIRVGDLLVTSDVPGTAMKSSPIEVAGTAIHRPGTIIGKALEPLESGTGEILVLLSLQ